ncbi:cyclase-associated protein 1-like protein [Tanacetum coccineum]
MEEKLIQRLESAVSRLESLASSGGSRSQPQSTVPFDAASASSDPSIVAFDDLLNEYVSKVTGAAEKIGGQVFEITNVLGQAFNAQKELLVKIKQTQVINILTVQKPDAGGMAEFLKPLNEKLMKANSMTEGPRSDFFNHLRSVAESLTALAWIAYTGKNCGEEIILFFLLSFGLNNLSTLASRSLLFVPIDSGMNMPISHVEECWQSAEFYSNKVLVEYRSKDPNHAEWAKALKELYVPGLRDFVKSHYALGPVWSATGATVSAPAKSSKPGAPSAPNPPPASLSSSGASSSSSSSSSQPKQGMSAVFQEISSKPVTAGLRKVTDDMKSKNRKDRAGIVSSGEKEARKSAPSAAKVGPPKLELVMGRKWVVENQIGVKDLCIDECDAKQTVYIFGCKDSVLQVKGKVNNITVDKCTKMGVLFTDVVAAFEIVNCNSVEVQCQGAAPTISIDNTSGCQLYLSKDSLESSITTAKASEVNVMVPAEDPDADMAEHAMPQQYIHIYKDGNFITTPVSHSGGRSELEINDVPESKANYINRNSVNTKPNSVNVNPNFVNVNRNNINVNDQPWLYYLLAAVGVLFALIVAITMKY